MNVQTDFDANFIDESPDYLLDHLFELETDGAFAKIDNVSRR